VSGEDGTPDCAEDERLARVAALCAALPQAVRETAERHAKFRVRCRTTASRRPTALVADEEDA
jgi:hypothetical protein